MQKSASKLPALTIGAIGIVYGDIGTSVLYAFKEAFVHTHMVVNEFNVLGVLSLFIWALVVVVALKYVLLVMRADNNGEGGLMALLALASSLVKERPRTQALMLAVGVFGVALFFGDGVITPAISVLSAIEGIEVATPAAKTFVIPIALVVLAALFLVQRRGTADIGRFFGPIMVAWFLIIGGMGVVRIAGNPAVLLAFLPTHAFAFAAAHPGLAFITLGAVFLCLTGAEALYADMGHFGVVPIRLAWFTLVMPSLVLNYLGQGATVLADPKTVENPFYLMAPPWALVPLVVLATMATVIASQALISGAFSTAKQAIQLGFLPRMTVTHTSAQETGQIYMPAVNWMLLAGVVLAVGLFRSSNALAAAYGISVSLLMVITTILTFFVVRDGWRYPLWLACLATGFFLLVDTIFVASNALKVADGGWFPLLLAGVLYAVMATWKRGRELVAESTRADSFELCAFLDSVFLDPPQRVPGTAVFVGGEPDRVPNALLHSLKHYKVLHARNLFVTIKSHEVPWIDVDQRVRAEPLGHDCWRIAIDYGFKDDFDVPAALQLIQAPGFELNPMATSYFLSRNIIVPSVGNGMARWREKLFAQMYQNAGQAAEFLKLPSNAVVELGAKVNI